MAPYVHDVRTHGGHGDTDDTHVLSLTIHKGGLKGRTAAARVKSYPGLAGARSFVQDMGKGPGSSIDSYSE